MDRMLHCAVRLYYCVSERKLGSTFHPFEIANIRTDNARLCLFGNGMQEIHAKLCILSKYPTFFSFRFFQFFYSARTRAEQCSALTLMNVYQMAREHAEHLLYRTKKGPLFGY